MANLFIGSLVDHPEEHLTSNSEYNNQGADTEHTHKDQSAMIKVCEEGDKLNNDSYNA